MLGSMTATCVTRLTPREDQILELIGEGLTNRQIGTRLNICEKTVKNTVTVVFAKLGLQRRAQAAVYVTERRLGAEHLALSAG